MSVPRQTRRILWIARHLTPTSAAGDRRPLPDAAGRSSAGSPIRRCLLDRRSPTPTARSLAPSPGRQTGRATRPSTMRPSLPRDILRHRPRRWPRALGLLRRAMMRRAAAFAARLRLQPILRLPRPVGCCRAATAAGDRRSAIVEAGNSPIDGVVANDFEIEYQPIFDLRAETMVGVEALLRWTKPDGSPCCGRKTPQPGRSRQLLDRVGILAIRRAADEIAPLLGVMLTVAVTPGQLQSGVFAEKVAGTFGATNFPARRLQLARRLPIAARRRRDCASSIAELRHKGVLIALSGFAIDGTDRGLSRCDSSPTACGSPRRLDRSQGDWAGARCLPRDHDRGRARAAGLAVTGAGCRAQGSGGAAIAAWLPRIPG